MKTSDAVIEEETTAALMKKKIHFQNDRWNDTFILKFTCKW